MSLSLDDVISYGGALSDGDLLIPAAVEFGDFDRDTRPGAPKVPKVLRMDAPSVLDNVCALTNLDGDIDAKSVRLVRPDGAPLEMYGFCKRFKKKGRAPRFLVRGASTTSSGCRFSLCKELMEVVCLCNGKKEEEPAVGGPNLLDEVDSEKGFAETLSDIVKLVKSPWVDLIRNPDSLNDETASFYMSFEVLIPRRLNVKLEQVLDEYRRQRIGRNMRVGFSFAIPPEVADHFFKLAIVKDGQGGVKCSYCDYRKQEARKNSVKELEKSLQEDIRTRRGGKS